MARRGRYNKVVPGGKYSKAKYKDFIAAAKNIDAAITASGLTDEEIATHIGKQKSSVSSYRSADTKPSVDVLVKLSKLLNVSCDYLLGLTDIRTPDISSQEICRITGLSEESVEILKFLNKPYSQGHDRITDTNRLSIDFINYVLENSTIECGCVGNIFSLLQEYIYSSSFKASEYDSVLGKRKGTGFDSITLSFNTYAHTFEVEELYSAYLFQCIIDEIRKMKKAADKDLDSQKQHSLIGSKGGDSSST